MKKKVIWYSPFPIFHPRKKGMTRMKPIVVTVKVKEVKEK